MSILKNLNELYLVYTIDDNELIPITRGIELKRLVISGDLLSNKENKNYLNDLRKKGVKIEIVGPVI